MKFFSEFLAQSRQPRHRYAVYECPFLPSFPSPCFRFFFSFRFSSEIPLTRPTPRDEGWKATRSPFSPRSSRLLSSRFLVTIGNSLNVVPSVTSYQREERAGKHRYWDQTKICRSLIRRVPLLGNVRVAGRVRAFLKKIISRLKSVPQWSSLSSDIPRGLSAN